MIELSTYKTTIFDWFLHPQLNEISYNIAFISIIISSIAYIAYQLLKSKKNLDLINLFRNIGIIIIFPISLYILFFTIQSISSNLSRNSVNKSLSITLKKNGILSNTIHQNLIPKNLNDLSQKQINASKFLYNSFNFFIYGRLGIILFINILIHLSIIISPIIAIKIIISKQETISFEPLLFLNFYITKILISITDLLLFSSYFQDFIQFIEDQDKNWKYSINQNLCLSIFFITCFITYLSTFWLGKKISKFLKFRIHFTEKSKK